MGVSKRGRVNEGRPQIYTKELAEKVLEKMKSGATALEVGQDPELPSWNTIQAWCERDPEFLKSYTRAQEICMAARILRTIEIAQDRSKDITPYERTRTGYQGDKAIDIIEKGATSDNTAVQRDKLMIDTAFRVAAKLCPALYGDKIQQEVTGKDGADLIPALTINVVAPSAAKPSKS